MIRTFVGCLFFVLLFACGKIRQRQESIVLIGDSTLQESIFSRLVDLTNGTIPERLLDDSLAFLILPVQASCPSCRNKTIDSIVECQSKLSNRDFVVISANGGRKAIRSFFLERDKDLPEVGGRFFLDSTNQAHRYDLYVGNPTIYYTYNKKAYKKVATIPTTIKNDLREFFSGK